MPYTLPVSFDQFLDRISPSSSDASTAATRADAVVDLLRSSFEILEIVPTGSLPRGTGLKSRSDADVLVALHYGKHIEDRSPTQVLQAVRDCLADYNARIVKKNGQAVTLYFKTWPNVDIVPASRVTDDGKFLHYNIPDTTRGTWIPSEPRVHDRAMARLTIQQRQLVQMVKEWNSAHSHYLQSFHIETLALLSSFGQPDWPWEILHFFDQAVGLLDGPLQHPAQPGVWVDDYLGYSGRQEAKKRLETARDQARTAWHAVYPPNDDPASAIRIYERMFGDRFPRYG